MTWQEAIPKIRQGAQTPAACEASMDHDAFALFYERSSRPLWAYLARVSGDRSLADDLMQESYVRFLGAKIPDGDVAARKYLFRIASNLLKDYWRRPRASSLDDMAEEFFAAADVSCQSDSAALLGPSLNRMSPRERQLLWLAHAEEYTHKEIAEVMGLASASVRIMLFRARHKIAKALRERGIDAV
ncbi:RNA polymerase sigma-70 factor, ECF subfamily [Granulicella pectinivorans]|jgi:RNA polymerase sigma-70 factor (ECF subfamily)|uniref:RNA polymerase sigma-70 factor, ECF subfamily n=1 Tax=Granulicella pectinivorans TaxID=474950 RepID=A0A1I6MYH4_9BACT|nr:RNA polymerase sigma factor [Granulicella pectinivorans]SFS20745.1 RNA polymerase sigma-70 factor, ECF subfamily [Granulicella pectinivorans]